MRRGLDSLLLCFCLFGGADRLAAGAEPPEWAEVRATHFHVLTDGPPKKARQIGRRLEQLHQLLGWMFPAWRLDPPVPPVVVLFDDSQNFQRYLPLVPRGQGADLDGFVQLTQERKYLVVNMGGEHPLASAFHEFLHLLVLLNYAKPPVWVTEGLALFFEQTEVKGGKFALGGWKPVWIDFLKRASLIPLEYMITLDQRSDYFMVEEKRKLFFLESWLLVHYLLLAENGRYRSSFVRFLTLLRQEVPQKTALREAFGTDFAPLLLALRDYVLRDRLAVSRGRLPTATKVKLPRPARLSPVVAQAYLADLWLNAGRLAEAEQVLLPLADSDASSPELRERLGRIALARDRPEVAQRHFQTALAARPDDIILRYYAALAVNRGRMGVENEPQERLAAASRIIELLTPVVEPGGFAPAYHLLLQARQVRGDPAADIIPLLEQARQHLLAHHDFDLLLAELYARERRWDEAEFLLESIKARSASDAQRRQAEKLLQQLEWARQSPVPQAPGDSVPEEETPGPPIPDFEEAAERPPPAPPPEPPMVAYVKGTLVNVACPEEDSAVLAIKQESRAQQTPQVIRLLVRSRRQVIQMDPTGSGQKLSCGLSEIPVGVNYIVEPGLAEAAGVVMAIEFYPPKR